MVDAVISAAVSAAVASVVSTVFSAVVSTVFSAMCDVILVVSPVMLGLRSGDEAKSGGVASGNRTVFSPAKWTTCFMES